MHFFPKIVPGDVVRMHPAAIKELVADGILNVSDSGDFEFAEGVELIAEGGETAMNVAGAAIEFTEGMEDTVVEMLEGLIDLLT